MPNWSVLSSLTLMIMASMATCNGRHVHLGDHLVDLRQHG